MSSRLHFVGYLTLLLIGATACGTDQPAPPTGNPGTSSTNSNTDDSVPNENTNNSDGTSRSDAAVPVSTFSSIQTEIFTPSCALSGCHSGGSPDGDLDLTEGQAYADLVSTSPDNNDAVFDGLLRVDPGDASNSLLIKKLEGDPDYGAQMPRNGSPLASEQIEPIREWINSGAPNN